MRICYDHQIFSAQNFGGVSRYFAELFRAFASDSEVQLTLPLWLSDNQYLASRPIHRHCGVLGGRKFKGRIAVLDWLNRFASRRALRQGHFDVFHPTYYHPYFLQNLGRQPFVLTVYDMIHENFPEMFPRNDRVSGYKRALIPRAARIIAISENTKVDIIRHFRIKPERIEVIHLANSLEASPDSQSQVVPDLPEKYVLFVGTRTIYKNFSRFLRAIAPLFRADCDLRLVCAGGGSLKPSEHDEVRALGLDGRISVRRVDDRILFHLYRNARAFVFPSLYEGFGLPVLEAFSAGCPIALSNVSSLPEIAGDAAQYFDPLDEDSIRKTVLGLVYDEAIRKDCIEKGYRRLAEFSWRETARKTKALYYALT